MQPATTLDPASCWEGKETGGAELPPPPPPGGRGAELCDLAVEEKAAITAGIQECLEVTLCDNNSERNSEVQRRAAEFRGADYKV